MVAVGHAYVRHNRYRTIASRFTVRLSIILAVMTTVKEPCVVAILLLHSNATSVGILIRHWLERATNVRVLVVDFHFALMARERRWPWRFASCDVSTL